MDWSKSALGIPQSWPQTLKFATDIILGSPAPYAILWGPRGVLIYNDAYSEIAGAKHPACMGVSVFDAWPEVNDFNHDVVNTVLAGQTLSLVDQQFLLHRNGAAEPVFLTLDYSPIPDSDGKPAGVLALVYETTRRVVLEEAFIAEQAATKALNRRLAAERDGLKEMFQQAPGFMCMLRGPQHIFEMTNASYERLIGHRAVIGKPLAAALPELADQHFARLLDTVYKSGEAYVGRKIKAMLQVTRDAPLEERFVDFVYQPVKDADGEVTGIFVEGVDVTEHIRAVTAEQENEEQFRSLAEAVPMQVWAADAEGSLYWFNARVYADTGAEPGALNGANWGQVLHPDDLPTATETWARALKDGERYETEFRIWNNERQSFRWHLVRAQPVCAGDRVLRWIGTNTDIQDQKLAARELSALNATLEERVAERTAELDRLWRLSGDLIVVVGFDDEIKSTNPAWKSLLDWDADQLIGQHFMDFVHPDDVELTLLEAKKNTSGIVRTTPFENRYRHRDGSYRWISWTSVPDGRVVHGVGRDVTAEREAEDALRQSEAALRQSQKMEAVGQLTGGIAHDFNNLLQGIVGSIELSRKLISLGRVAETEKFINSAMNSAQRAAALTHRLLAFSRRQPLDPKPLQINQLVLSMEDMLRRTVGVLIEIELDLSTDAWITKCDANQVESAILNLVINSRDAMPHGGRISIRTSNGNGPGDQSLKGEFLCIAVVDNGCGMPADVLARAFDPFFTTKPTGQGTGLGLSMIYGFAQQSNGFAKITSEVGNGAMVELFLPRYLGALESDETQESASSDHHVVAGTTILVIEDDSVVRDLAVRVLSDLGYNVIEAADGPSGLKILESDKRIHLVLTDIGLPGLNGRQVVDAARIKRHDLMVLFMTGYAENAALADGFLERGMQMITKPFSMEKLTGRIRDMFDEREREITRDRLLRSITW
ncbi:MAG: PAS domain S-box protein [Betaproteobacteria bacterium]